MTSFLINHLISKSIRDKEFRKKMLIIFIILISFCLFILTTIISIPSLIINGVFGEDLEDINKIQIYQDAILIIDEKNHNWIENMKEKHSDCHRFHVEYNYKLTWYELMSIDSVRYNQDFEDVLEKDIIKLADKFIKKDVKIEEEEVEVGYEEEIETRKKAIITIETKEYEDVFEDVNIVEEEDILLANNIYETLLGLDIEENMNIYDRSIDLANLKEYPEGKAKTPYYNQTDKRWGGNSYGNSTIYSGGCGPTSLAMVVSGLTNKKITPDIVANWSYTNGHRAEGQGSYWSLMTEGGAYYGLEVEPASRRQTSRIKKALRDGHVVIASMGKGHFTKGGHFIVLRGITNEGKILVHDPASIERSSKKWDLNLIINESSTNGGVSGNPFWIFKI